MLVSSGILFLTSNARFMTDEMMIEDLLERIAAFHPLSDELRNDLKSRLEIEKYARGQYLLKAGSICQRMHFIVRGLVHCYSGSRSKPETDYFMTEGEIALMKESFYMQKPSDQHIEAMEKTTTVSISYTDLEYIYARHLTFNINGRKMMELYYQRSNFKLQLLRTKGPDERYHFLKMHRPELIERVHGKYLASFLNMREETYCRIKTKVKKKKGPYRRKKKRHS
jgi:CRP/FNR family transcriptional regulator, anaerobic regulatory protein